MATHNRVVDDGARFQIVPATRKITVPQSNKIIGIVGDHKSEQVTFQCPKLIDGHDVLNCTEHYIIYKDANGVSGRKDIQPENITFDADNLYLTWIIEREITAAAGNVSIAMHFVDKDAEGNIIYRWSTTPCKECQVLDGLVNDNPAEEIIPEGYFKPTGAVEINANGDHDVKEYATAHVDVKPSLQNKTVTENGTVTADEGYDGLSSVKVDVKPGDEYLIPSGTKDITENGEHDVGVYAKAKVEVKPKLQDKTVTSNIKVFPDSGYDGLASVYVAVPPPDGYVPEPTETLSITENKEYDVKAYAAVEVNVPIPDGYVKPDGKLEVASNGTYDVTKKAQVVVAVPDTGDVPEGYIKPEGTTPITTNGIHNVNDFEFAEVNVPIPDGYVPKPTGTVEITENTEQYDVSEYQYAKVNVPIPAGYVKPEGTKTITENKDGIDVKGYAAVNVNVPIPDGYIVPSGDLTITENNKQYDVNDKESVTVNIPVPTLNETTITENGEVTAPDGTAYSKVTVNVQPKLQEKTVTANNADGITPDEGYDGFSKVIVKVPTNDVSVHSKVADPITANGRYTYYPDEGAHGLSQLTVSVEIPEYDGTIEVV